MTTQPKHTPTPWDVHYTAEDEKGRTSFTIEAETQRVANVMTGNCEFAVAEENAAFIVRACNSHEMLLDALNGCLLYFTEQKEGTRAGTHPSELFELVLTALEKAEQ